MAREGAAGGLDRAAAATAEDRPEDWLAAGSRAGYEIGDVIKRVRPNVVFGDRGVIELADCTPLAVGRRGAVSSATPGAPEDARTLAVKTDIVGDRSRPFSEAVRDTRAETISGWPIAEPRTCLWLPQHFAKLGYTPLQGHRWWRQVQGLKA